MNRLLTTILPGLAYNHRGWFTTILPGLARAAYRPAGKGGAIYGNSTDNAKYFAISAQIIASAPPPKPAGFSTGRSHVRHN